MHDMCLAGMNSSFASMGSAQGMWHKCSYNHCQSHLGYKMSMTARSYSITVNHCHRILSSTQGWWNDKTLVLHDDLAWDIYKGTCLSDVEFMLFEQDGGGNIVECKYQGVWLIVDNWYLAWPTTTPPFKNTVNIHEIYLLQWLESMQKDVKCTFGILKEKWRNLKSGIYLQTDMAIDCIWFTCCALHNWLLEADGCLDEQWHGGVPSDWEGEMGEHNEPGYSLLFSPEYCSKCY